MEISISLIIVLVIDFRIAGSNIDYKLQSIKKNKNVGKFIFITSSMKGEGKSFFGAKLGFELCLFEQKSIASSQFNPENPFSNEHLERPDIFKILLEENS